MKLTLLMFLFALAGCGGKNASVNLKVTGSMMLSNADFAGGMMVQGKGPNGAVFSRFLGHVAGSAGTQFSINLPKGSWTFEAIGYAGPNLLEGAPKCARTVPQDLSSDNSQVEILLGDTDCALGTFGSGAFLSGNQFKNLKIVTCGQYYKADGTVVATEADNIYCNSPSTLKTSVKRWAVSARVSPLIKELGSPWKPDLNQSVCLGSNGQGTLIRSPAALNLAVQGLPLHIDLYHEANCTGSSHEVSYSFPRGLGADYLQDPVTEFRQEKILASGTTTNYLYLAMNKTRRGTSSFGSLLPSISCGGGTCVSTPTLPGSVDVVAGNGTRYFLGEKTASENCGTLSWSGGTMPGNCSEGNIENSKDKVGLFIHMSAAALGACSTSCTFQYRFDASDPYQNLVVRYSTSPIGFAFDNLFRSLGHYQSNIVPATLHNSIFTLADQNSDFGKLRRAREVLGPDGPGGVLGNVTCDPAMKREERINFFEDGQLRTYRVLAVGRQASGVSHPIPKYICEDLNPEATSCPTSPVYDVVMRVQRLKNLVWETESVTKLLCSRKIGEIEEQDSDSDGSYKELLYWNTNADAMSRYEVYASGKELNASGGVKGYHTEYERAEESTTTKVLVDSFRFSSHFNSATNNFSQHVDYTRAGIAAGQMSYTHKHGSTVHIDQPLSLFTDASHSAFERNTSPTKSMTYATSPNGSYVVRAYYESGKMKFRHVSPAPSITIPDATSGVPLVTKLAVNDSGIVVACWIVNTTFDSYCRIWDGSSSLPLTIDTTNDVFQLDVVLKPDNNFYVTTIKNIAGDEFLQTVAYDLTLTPTPWTDIPVPPATVIDTEMFEGELLRAWVQAGASNQEIHFSRQGAFAGAPTFDTAFPLGDPVDEVTINTGGYDPLISVSGNLAGANYVEVFRLNHSNSVFNQASYSNIHMVSEMAKPRCFSLTAPVYLDQDGTDCPILQDASFAPPVKPAFRKNFESLNPTTFDTVFRNANDFKN